jgi:uncharacterized protein YegP (UPF0339 family)
MKLKDIFEDRLLKEDFRISQERKKIGGEFRKKYYIKKNNGEVIGKQLGYQTKEEAVKDLLAQKDKNFFSLTPAKQREKVDRYIKRHKLDASK